MQEVIMILNTYKNNKHHTGIKQNRQAILKLDKKKAFIVAFNQLALPSYWGAYCHQFAPYTLGTAQGSHTRVVSGSHYR